MQAHLRVSNKRVNQVVMAGERELALDLKLIFFTTFEYRIIFKRIRFNKG